MKALNGHGLIRYIDEGERKRAGEPALVNIAFLLNEISAQDEKDGRETYGANAPAAPLQ